MDIRLDPKTLLSELSLAMSIVESKATIPILSNILLRAEGDSLEIAATDLEVTLRTRCPAEVLSPGSVTVPAKKFGSMIRGFQGIDKPLSLMTTEDQKLFVQPVEGKEEYHLQTLPEEDYPTLLETKGEPVLTLESGPFRRAVAEALVSVGQEDNRYSVRGALMLLEADSVSLVSTDSHRLGRSIFPVQTGVTEPVRVLIPRKTLTELLKLDGDAGIGMTLEDNHIFLQSGHRILYSRLMDSTFPAFERVIPADVEKIAVLNRLVLLEKLRRVSTVAELKTKMITITFDPTGSVVISARNRETGDEGKEYLPCSRYEGEELLAAFNVDYLVDFLSIVDTEEIFIKMKDQNSQALLEPARDEAEGGFAYVVMPLRLD